MPLVHLVDQFAESLIDLGVLHLLGTLFGPFEQLSVEIEVHRLFDQSHVLQQLCSRLVSTNVLESLRHDAYHVLGPVSLEVECQLHRPFPALLQLVVVWQTLLL